MDGIKISDFPIRKGGEFEICFDSRVSRMHKRDGLRDLYGIVEEKKPTDYRIISFWGAIRDRFSTGLCRSCQSNADWQIREIVGVKSG